LMANIFSDDFKDFIQALNDNGGDLPASVCLAYIGSYRNH
jgi:hypothetical protein